MSDALAATGNAMIMTPARLAAEGINIGGPGYLVAIERADASRFALRCLTLKSALFLFSTLEITNIVVECVEGEEVTFAEERDAIEAGQVH